MKEITEDTYGGFINQPLGVITFTSPWCTSCKKVASSLEAIRPKIEGQVSLGSCDVSVNPGIASSLQILSLPAVVIFKNGVEVKKIAGPVSEAALLRTLKELL